MLGNLSLRNGHPSTLRERILKSEARDGRALNFDSVHYYVAIYGNALSPARFLRECDRSLSGSARIQFTFRSLTGLRAAVEEGAGRLDRHRRESAVRDLSRAVPTPAISLYLRNEKRARISDHIRNKFVFLCR